MRTILGRITNWDCRGIKYEKLGITDVTPKIGEAITYFNYKNIKIDTGKIINAITFDDSDPMGKEILNNGTYVVIYED